MPTARQLEDATLAGNRARQFLDNPLFASAVESAKNKIFSRWVQTSPEDTAKREACWHEWHGLERLVRELTTDEDEGKLAAKQIEQDNYRRKMGA